MNKTILFTLIEREINELEILVKGMKEIDTLSPTLLLLAKSKITSILEDLDQVNYLASTERLETFTVQPDKIEKIETGIPDETKQETYKIPKVEQTDQTPVQHSRKEYHEQKIVPSTIPNQPIEDKGGTMHLAASLAETLNTAKQSLNEAIALQAEASLSETMQNSKVDDLRQALSLADRFRFQRELFGGNGEKLNTTLTQLNAAKDKDEAIALLQSFNWDERNPHVSNFIRLVLRKFIEN
jgi:hypothetical protein